MKDICILWIISLFILIGMPLNAAAQDIDYPSWLQRYEAWDQLEQNYAQSASTHSNADILQRAQLLLNLNSPDKALELLEMTSSFDDVTLETKRLILGGQAHRALGDPTKAIIWFSQASQHLTDDQINEEFAETPGLQSLWEDAFRQILWNNQLNFTISRDAQFEVLGSIITTGAKIWPTVFWEEARNILTKTTTSATQIAANNQPELVQQYLEISDKDRSIIAQSLAFASLELYNDAYGNLANLSQTPCQHFWSTVIRVIESGDSPVSLESYEKESFAKAFAFWQARILQNSAGNTADWLLGNPESETWKNFRNNLLALPHKKVLPAINTELKSMLISDETRSLLQAFKLAFAIANGFSLEAKSTWNSIDKSNIPHMLQLSGTILFKDNFKNISGEKAETNSLKHCLIQLLSAAGTTPITDIPFWVVVPRNELQALSVQFRFDRLLLLANWQQQLDTSPTLTLAKRGAYLFTDNAFGSQALLYLADSAVSVKDLRLSAFYLNQVNGPSLQNTQKGLWLDVKCRLEYAAGRQNDALETFKELVALGSPIQVMTRLKMALLLQQNRDYQTAREQLMILWKDKQGLSTALQAEIMFWLAEGEQGSGNVDAALDDYMRLAWQYPQENIWALTSMYRASIIYEQRGKYETAKKLLNAVVEQADRKEQKEAATARLAAIDAKMGTREQETVYPF